MNDKEARENGIIILVLGIVGLIIGLVYLNMPQQIKDVFLISQNIWPIAGYFITAISMGLMFAGIDTLIKFKKEQTQ